MRALPGLGAVVRVVETLPLALEGKAWVGPIQGTRALRHVVVAREQIVDFVGPGTSAISTPSDDVFVAAVCIARVTIRFVRAILEPTALEGHGHLIPPHPGAAIGGPAGIATRLVVDDRVLHHARILGARWRCNHRRRLGLYTTLGDDEENEEDARHAGQPKATSRSEWRQPVCLRHGGYLWLE